MQDKT